MDNTAWPGYCYGHWNLSRITVREPMDGRVAAG
jgi:hypothetical protein